MRKKGEAIKCNVCVCVCVEAWDGTAVVVVGVSGLQFLLHTPKLRSLRKH